MGNKVEGGGGDKEGEKEDKETRGSLAERRWMGNYVKDKGGGGEGDGEDKEGKKGKDKERGRG